jgi:signal transduction histidine kinase
LRDGEARTGVPVRLLLVEDSENDAMLLLRELRRGGYEPNHERLYTPEGMERALGEIRDAERNRIARELHDSILQDIVYALQEIQVLQVTHQNGLEPALGGAADALRR